MSCAKLYSQPVGLFAYQSSPSPHACKPTQELRMSCMVSGSLTSTNNQKGIESCPHLNSLQAALLSITDFAQHSTSIVHCVPRQKSAWVMRADVKLQECVIGQYLITVHRVPSCATCRAWQRKVMYDSTAILWDPNFC